MLAHLNFQTLKKISSPLTKGKAQNLTLLSYLTVQSFDAYSAKMSLFSATWLYVEIVSMNAIILREFGNNLAPIDLNHDPCHCRIYGVGDPTQL